MPERDDHSAGTAGSSAPGLDSQRRSAMVRGAALFALWLVVMQSGHVADLVFGLCVSGAATWVSLRLSPPAAGRLRIGGLLLLLPHFLWQSVRAGVDVARRALWPRLDLHPGLVEYPLAWGPGMARNTFSTITSLLPGSVPCDDIDGVLVYHCLDVTQPVVAQLRDEERRIAAVVVAGRSHA